MPRKVLAFAASNSSVSINRQLVEYAASHLEDAEVEFLDIHDYEMPIYRHDREEAEGIPQLAHDFRAKIAAADALLVSFAEHNGLYCAAFKNLFDWASRVGRDVWAGKPMVLLAASPGPGGAARVLALAETAAPHFAGEVKGTLSVPGFYHAFDAEAGRLRDDVQVDQLRKVLAKL
ncbi:NAD(P)H-dependent oxidoreductase [Aurantiacibacter sp. MUD11]|uniref:NADPH-dependent FMN reductase n=1 Tax=Aurantiacibacter sp. MUD11 TaxID=3003265 RepID=UPI0022AB09FD|nr:NAD(P)H-dependent oxidoreductase [Aurantiacibacter sp. MUD11]WAT17690.1 NAD(P)H-dependent oxidoreductase [Aurantiacibacter sp. MUD11]